MAPTLLTATDDDRTQALISKAASIERWEVQPLRGPLERGEEVDADDASILVVDRWLDWPWYAPDAAGSTASKLRRLIGARYSVLLVGDEGELAASRGLGMDAGLVKYRPSRRRVVPPPDEQYVIEVRRAIRILLGEDPVILEQTLPPPPPTGFTKRTARRSP